MDPEQIAISVAKLAASEVRSIMRDRIAWTRKNPYKAWKYHSAKGEAMPRWARIRIGIQRARARTAWALWRAEC